MLFYGWSCDRASCINGKSRAELPSPYEAPLGFDHGVGPPLLLLCDAKVPNCQKNKAFKDFSHYSEWPNVADAVIETSRKEAAGVLR